MHRAYSPRCTHPGRIHRPNAFHFGTHCLQKRADFDQEGSLPPKSLHARQTCGTIWAMDTAPETPDPSALQMVREQIAARGVTDPRVLDAMARVPRASFVPREWQPHAYEDRPLPIGCAQTISQPYMVAHMTELLRLSPTSRVLEIGTGSGYQTAVLAALAGRVVSIERHAALAEAAAQRLTGLGYRNVAVFTGDGSAGMPAEGPYDAILVTAGAPVLPNALEAQLADGGRLVCPVGPREQQQLLVVTRQGTAFQRELGTKCMFVPLVGASGWPES